MMLNEINQNYILILNMPRPCLREVFKHHFPKCTLAFIDDKA
jgi:hypothetical protein